MAPILSADEYWSIQREVQWGTCGLPESNAVRFDYPKNQVRRLSDGMVVSFRLSGLDRQFYAIVGREADYMGSANAGRFIYFLRGEPLASYVDHALSSDDLWLMPLRIWRTPKNFSMSGFPFVESPMRVPAESLFTGHPTTDTSVKNPPDSVGGPYGDNPSPLVPPGISDLSIRSGLMMAHWMEATIPGRQFMIEHGLSHRIQGDANDHRGLLDGIELRTSNVAGEFEAQSFEVLLQEHEAGDVPEFSVTHSCETPMDSFIVQRGHEPNGYFWEGVAELLIQSQAPHLRNRFSFDSEAGMFCAYGNDRDALEQLRQLITDTADDPNGLALIFDLAENTGFGFDD